MYCLPLDKPVNPFFLSHWPKVWESKPRAKPQRKKLYTKYIKEIGFEKSLGKVWKFG